jgi:hypothetical protein
MRRSRINRLPVHSYRKMFRLADRMMREEITARKEVALNMEGIYGAVSHRIHADSFIARHFRDDAALYECLTASIISRT